MIRLDSRANEYLKRLLPLSHLPAPKVGWGGLSDCGSCEAILPGGADSQDPYSFEVGPRMAPRLAPNVFDVAAGFIRDEVRRSRYTHLIFDHWLARSGDRVLSRYESPVRVLGDFVFLVLTASAGEVEISRAMRESLDQPVALGFGVSVSRAVEEEFAKERDLNLLLPLGEVSDVRLILAGAYDGQGFLLWRPDLGF